jgi:hypothetical protein
MAAVFMSVMNLAFFASPDESMQSVKIGPGKNNDIGLNFNLGEADNSQ